MYQSALPIWLTIAVALTLLSRPVQAQDKANALAIIVNKASPLDDVSKDLAAKYFKAEKTKAPDGTKIVILMQDTGRPERAAALKGIYKMSEAEYSDYFVGQTFTGAVAAAPKALASGAAVKNQVANLPGGLGYIRASEADDTVKVLKIDGKTPEDPAYAFKL